MGPTMAVAIRKKGNEEGEGMRTRARSQRHQVMICVICVMICVMICEEKLFLDWWAGRASMLSESPRLSET